MHADQIASILVSHKHWLINDPAGCRANLSGANLSGADLFHANLPSPTVMLLANWGDLSDVLCPSHGI